MQNKKIVTSIVAVLAVAVIWVFFPKNGQAPSVPTTKVEDTSLSQPVTDIPTTHEFVITAQNFSFLPSTLTVKKGYTVKITFNNVEGTHDFVIDEFKVATNKIKGGQQETVEFVADKSGSFEYYCSIGTHRQMGMKGKLIVE